MDAGSRREAISETIGHLAARWAHADKRILRQVFPLLVEGQPVRVARIAEATGRTSAMVEAALELGRAERDEQGRIVELSGLMLSASMHRVEIGNVALFSCCALFSQVVPSLIGRPVRVESIDPVSRRIVRLAIAPEGVTEVEPAEAVGSFVLTEASRMAGDVGAYFCRHVHHFASSQSASAFLARDRRRFAVGIGDLNEAAHMLYRAAWARGERQ